MENIVSHKVVLPLYASNTKRSIYVNSQGVSCITTLAAPLVAKALGFLVLGGVGLTAISCCRF